MDGKGSRYHESFKISKDLCLVGLGRQRLPQSKFWLPYLLVRRACEKRRAAANAPTIIIAFAATSLPYLLPLAEPFRYRHPLARVPVTAAVIDGNIVLLPARKVISCEWALLSWHLRALRRWRLCAILGLWFTSGQLLTECVHS